METDKVTGQPIPAEEIGERATLAGNWMDNDWSEINRMEQDAAEPPPPKDLPQDHRDQHYAKPRPISRMITRTVILSVPAAGSQPVPVMLLPTNPYRKSIHLEVYSATATDAVRVTDDGGKAYGDSEAAVVGSFSGGLNIEGHTGNLYVTLPTAGQLPYTVVGPVLVSVIAVTEVPEHE